MRAMRLIENMRELERLAGRLAGETLIAADTEAAGYHRYLDRLCLLQLSTRDETWIVDTVSLSSLNPLAEAFEAPQVEVVFHDADYDLRLLDRDFGVQVRGLFDTKIAARFAGERSFGLAHLLGDGLGVALQKKHQRADWAKRPLSQELLEYAAMDTRYLPQLRDLLRDRLVELGRIHWAEEEFRIQERARWEPPAGPGEEYLRLKGTRDLERRGLAALRELYGWRERVAAERDVAAFRVVTNEVLLETARRLPRNPQALGNVPGLSPGNARRWGDGLIAAVDRAMALPESELPERARPPRRPQRDPELEARVDRLKRARDEEADRLALERGFLMPRAQLEDVASQAPADEAELRAIPGIRRWQVEAVGAALLHSLGGNGQPSRSQGRPNGN
jgi:ribonuclease D